MPDRIEQLITRRLDGALTDDESLELDRALIRSPEYRHMFELSERIDVLCADALAEQVGTSADESAAVWTLRTRSGRGLAGRWVWWLMPAAAAACVGWMMWTGAVDVRPGSGGIPLVQTNGARGGVELVAGPARPETKNAMRPAFGTDGSRPASGIQQASTGIPSMSRMRDSNVYGIVGGEDRILLIEVDRIRTLQRSPALASAVPVCHEL
ncbi:MAG: hypothetical protein HOP29_06715 [Phycisphaerales bacterium]|nr:hypothetical protein [Phycisphaerales bacterium]